MFAFKPNETISFSLTPSVSTICFINLSDGEIRLPSEYDFIIEPSLLKRSIKYSRFDGEQIG